MAVEDVELGHVGDRYAGVAENVAEAAHGARRLRREIARVPPAHFCQYAYYYAYCVYHYAYCRIAVARKKKAIR